jgi:phage terminase small subunit
MALTQKQENFCLAYIKTGNAAESYKQCYNTENMKPESIYRKATELMANGTITARLQELRSKAESKAIMSVEERKELLTKIAQNVTFDKEGNAGFNDATKAIEILNKMDGIYIQKNQTELSGAVGVTFQIDLGDDK